MNLFFHSPLSQKVIQALSWTLIHSLWQGLILAVLTGLVLIITRKSKPVLRYNLLSGMLVVFLLLSSITFWWEFEQQSGSNKNLISHTFSGNSQFIANAVKADTGTANPTYKDHLASVSINFCSENAAIIVAIWFLVFLLKSVKAATGFYYIHHIRNYKIHSVDADWKHRLYNLCQQLNITRPIQLLESEIVRIPTVAGVLKPMILVPIGFLTNLPFNQVEAILLHELAHIKRQDYLVNLFQNIAENIFFFNPAVLWISDLIRQEREHCCDDLAISVTQNKTLFVHALVQFQEYNNAGNQHVIAFAGKRNHLLDRIKRIIYNNNKQLDAMEKLFVTASLITVTALSFAFSPTPVKTTFRKQAAPMQQVRTEPLALTIPKPMSPDTLPSKSGKKSLDVETIEITKNDKRYDIVKKNGEISELKIDGKVIPQNEFESYESEIEAILEEEEEQHEQAEIQREKAEVLKNESSDHRQHADKLRTESEQIRKMTDVQRVQTDELRKQAEAMRIDAEKIRKNVNETMNTTELSINANADFAKNTEEFRKQAELIKKDAEQFKVQAGVMREQAEGLRKHAEQMRASADVTRKEADKMRAEYEKLQSDLINDLIKEGVIKDTDNLSYRLSNDELIVNGVKQPEQLHARLKAKYVKDKSVEMVYNYKGRTGYTTTGLIYTK